MEIYLKEGGSAPNGNSLNISAYNVQEAVPQFSTNAIANKLGDIFPRGVTFKGSLLSKILF